MMMKILTSLNCNITENTAVTVGKFDGLHKGHEILTSKLREQEKKGLKSLVLTFDVSPRVHLKKDTEKLLITNDERISLFSNEDISFFVQCSFENEIMSLEPEEFIEILTNKFRMKYMVCGTDFRFGKKGRGDILLLQELADRYHFELEVMDKLKQDERDISSTFVREEIAKGNVAKAMDLLGYPYFIRGKVVHGNHLGSKIGIPTINFVPPQEKLLPKNGVYITKISVDNRIYHGVTNVGVKPTIKGTYKRGVETHILDFSQDIYEKYACVYFLESIREEKTFSSVEELKKQMLKDKQAALRYFNG